MSPRSELFCSRCHDPLPAGCALQRVQLHGQSFDTYHCRTCQSTTQGISRSEVVRTRWRYVPQATGGI